MNELHEETQISRSIWELERELARRPDSDRLKASLIRAFHLEKNHLEEHFGVEESDRTFLELKNHPSAGCLLIHGSPGSPAEMHDLGRFFYRNGFSVYGVRLPNHGLEAEALDRLSWRNVLAEVGNAYEVLHKVTNQVYVAGFGFGAVLALHVARRYQDVKGLILLSPPIYPKIRFAHKLLLPVRRVAPRFFSKIAGWNAECLEAVEEARGFMGEISTPILALQGKENSRGGLRGIRFLEKNGPAGKVRSEILEGTDHRVLDAATRDRVYECSLGFIRGK